MEAIQQSTAKRKGMTWRQFFKVIIFSFLVYAGTYVVNSFCGGYWLIPEMDGHDRYSFGLAMPTGVMWQPRFGHHAIGRENYLGVLYEPLILVDRRFVHQTIYLSDKNGFDRITHLPISRVHPEFRDDYVTDVKAVASFNNINRTIQCTLRLVGSDQPRSITEIRMGREDAKAWGVSPPDGFVESPYEAYQKYFVEHYIRWAGKVPLLRDHDIVLIFSAVNFATNTAKIQFQYDLDEKTKINHANICLANVGDVTNTRQQK